MSAALPARKELTTEQIQLIKGTVPVLVQHGLEITSLFYNNMLDNNVELKEIFNVTHQADLSQPKALTGALFAYATYIDNLAVLATAVDRICNKHCSLNVKPEQYAIVGQYLLAAMGTVLGAALTPEVLEAWTIAYWQLAWIMIDAESALYKQRAAAEGGWSGFRKFKIASKQYENLEQTICTFTLEAADGGKLPSFKPGQYVGVNVMVPSLGYHQIRQYSLSDAPSPTHFCISVKKDLGSNGHPAGLVSNTLHVLEVGAEIEVTPPYGIFTLDASATSPIVMISAGVGITPLLGMLRSLLEQEEQADKTPNKRPITFIHCTRDSQAHAMRAYIDQVVTSYPHAQKVIFYSKPHSTDEQGKMYDHPKRIDWELIKSHIKPEADYYMCGPPAFMAEQRKVLEQYGIPTERIHSEVFGSS